MSVWKLVDMVAVLWLGGCVFYMATQDDWGGLEEEDTMWNLCMLVLSFPGMFLASLMYWCEERNPPRFDASRYVLHRHSSGYFVRMPYEIHRVLRWAERELGMSVAQHQAYAEARLKAEAEALLSMQRQALVAALEDRFTPEPPLNCWESESRDLLWGADEDEVFEAIDPYMPVDDRAIGDLDIDVMAN